MPRGTPSLISLGGPGYLYAAVLGSTIPTNTVAANKFTDAWAAAWILLGYTEEGSAFSYAPSFENVDVAEELDPIDSVPTGREMKVSFAAAENTAQNYKRALNGGVITVTGSGGTLLTKYEPPLLGAETQIMLGWESERNDERWVFRQCKQTGSVETQRRKGSQKALIPMEFTVYKPANGTDLPFSRWSSKAAEPTS